MEGQQVFINKSAKVVILELRQVFNKAGKILNWDDKYGLQAFGINKSILLLIEFTKSKLLINFHSDKSKKEYWISHDELRKFVENNNCKYKVAHNNIIYNIPLVLFRPKPVFSGEINES